MTREERMLNELYETYMSLKVEDGYVDPGEYTNYAYLLLGSFNMLVAYYGGQEKAKRVLDGYMEEDAANDIYGKYLTFKIALQ